MKKISTNNLIKVIKNEADKLEKVYRDENEIHEDYYIWGLRRLEEVLIKKMDS